MTYLRKFTISFVVLFGGVEAQLYATLPNVLFIAIDDLRPDLNCYQETAAEQMSGPRARLPIRSPAIDSIASEGTVFERAYCQVALCGPSRLSVMTSTYPDRSTIYAMGASYGGDWRAYTEPLGLNLVSLPQQFRSHGYVAASYGKIYDNRLGTDVGISWDLQADESGGYVDSINSANKTAIEALAADDNAYRDGKNTDLALDFLATHDHSTPFFLALGFAKPHLPFNAPKKYWDLYDPSTFPLLAPAQIPVGMSDKTLSRPYKELETYTRPEIYTPIVQPTSETLTRQLIHGYLACISYVDAQIFKILSDLRARGLYDNTIIVVWGDHGFKLADFGEWAKATTLEVDSRVPLIIRLPESISADRDAHSYSIVELVDIMPTICEAAGLPIPATAQGRSLMPILKDAQKKVRQTALSQYKRGGMAYSVRSEQWRYTEFRSNDGTLEGRQLYDLSTAPYVESVNNTTGETYFTEALSALIYDYSQTGGTGDGGLTIHFGNDNSIDGNDQEKIPGATGNFSSENLTARMNGTGEASSYTSGALSTSAPGLTFNIECTNNNESDFRAQSSGLGLRGGGGNSSIDNDFGDSRFQESVTFSIDGVSNLPVGTQLVITEITLGFAAGEPIILNNGSETEYTSSIELTEQKNSLTIKAGATSESSFVVSSVTVDLINTNQSEPIQSIRRTKVLGNNFLADLQGSGTYNIWKSRSLNPALYTGPIKTQISEGDNRILDSEITEDSAFYIILPSGKSP